MLKLEIWLENRLTFRWNLGKNAPLKGKCILWDCATLFFKNQNTVVSKQNAKNNYNEPYVKLNGIINFQWKSIFPLDIIFKKGSTEAVRDGWEMKVKSNMKLALLGNDKNQLIEIN